ncbi:MAG: PfkB family carbohydrate kinase [Ruminococcus callidus]
MKQVLAMGEALIDFIPAQRDCLLKSRILYPCLRRCAGKWLRLRQSLAAKPYGHAAGEDAFGDYIVDTLQDAGVNTSCILRTDEANTALAFVSLADGNREFSFYRKPSADMLLRKNRYSRNGFPMGFFTSALSHSLMHLSSRHTGVPHWRRKRKR